MRTRLLPFGALLAFTAIGQAQTITTIAGTKNCCVTTDGGQATSTWLPGLGTLARDAQGNLYFWVGQKIKVMTPAGIINTAVGSGNINYNLANGPAASVNLGPNQPYSGLATDAAGNLYISDTYNHAIRASERRNRQRYHNRGHRVPPAFRAMEAPPPKRC